MLASNCSEMLQARLEGMENGRGNCSAVSQCLPSLLRYFVGDGANRRRQPSADCRPVEQCHQPQQHKGESGEGGGQRQARQALALTVLLFLVRRLKAELREVHGVFYLARREGETKNLPSSRRKGMACRVICPLQSHDVKQ